MPKVIFHIDVNSAFLSWSAVEKLNTEGGQDLRTIPAVIGGDTQKRHGIVLAKSIPAKVYGIETGEPLVNALRKCPGLVVEPPNHRLYSAKSRALMEYLMEFCPIIEQVSVDECYMDFSPIYGNYSSPVQAAVLLKDSVYEKFGFTVNIGISDRKVLAKMASDFKKPNRVHTLFHDEIEEKMWPLPVSSLYMCGKSSVEILRNLELLTIKDLANADLEILKQHLKSHGILLWEFANGIDDSEISTTQERAKGIGNSTTLERDLENASDAKVTLLHLCEKVSERLRKGNLEAGCVCIEIKYNNFQSVSHQLILPLSVDTTKTLYSYSCQLFDELWNGTPIRLLGVRATKLTDRFEPVQLSIFDLPNQKEQKLEHSLDALKQKYGKSIVMRGTFFHNENETKKPE